MRTVFFRAAKRILAAAALPVCLVCLLLLPRGSSSADSASFSVGDCSDDVLRAETRLSDLGYSARVVDGCWDEEDAAALAAFAAANGVGGNDAAAALFASDAVPASADAQQVSFFQSGTVLTVGSLMPWSEVKQRLIAGQTYTVTGCYSGIQLHMTFVSAGGHAVFRPALEWDDATLRGFFYSADCSEKQPVVFSIDGILVAASIQAAPASESDVLPGYSVYFTGSVSDINGIADAEHDSVVSIAGGG